MDLDKNLSKDEKQFLKDLKDKAEKVHGERKKDVLKRGLMITRESIEEEIDPFLERDVNVDEETIKSLEEKNIVKRFTEKQEKHHTEYEKTIQSGKNEEKTKRDRRTKVRKKVDQEYLKINKKYIDEIFTY